MKVLLVLLAVILAVSGCGITIHKGSPVEAYRTQAALNPSRICTPNVLQDVWDTIAKQYYRGATCESLMRSAVLALEKETQLSIEPPAKCSVSDFWILMDSIQRQSDKSLSHLCYASVKGIVAGVGDKFTTFAMPSQAHERARSMAGTGYYGIGFTMIADFKQKRLFADFIFEGTPADGRLERFDEILAVDGRRVRDLDLKTIMFKFRGKKGSKAYLLVRKHGQQKVQLMTFVRRKAGTRLARCQLVSGIPYCRVIGFAAMTADHLVESLKSLPEHSGKKFILDLRGNPGGLVFSATSMASRLWLGSKTLAIFLKREYGAVPFNDISKKILLKGYKTVVLIDRRSASASELLAAALRDYGKATFIGERTYGKGVSQHLKFVPGGGLLAVTSMYFLSPYGHVTHGHGIEPDIKIRLTREDMERGKDPVLAKALDFLRR